MNVKGAAWTDAELELLAIGWNEGKTTSVIGRMVNKSKNAVVGKARRIGLTARPNPVNQNPTPAQLEARRVAIARREQKADEMAAKTEAKLAEARAAVAKLEARPMPPVPLPLPAVIELVTPRAPARQLPFASVKSCQWIEKDPGAGHWDYCGEPCQRGEDGGPASPYCIAHHKRAYVKIWDKTRRAAERKLPETRPPID